MLYVEMKPNEIRNAVQRDVPVLMSSGSVEYHGPHLPIGTDWLIADTNIQRVDNACEVIVMPPMPFSPTMFWAGGPKEGEFDFDPEAMRLYAREVFRGLVKIGFRRIYVLQHHQGDNGLPCLTLKRAAAEVVRETALGWAPAWGRLSGEAMPDTRIFSMIKVAFLDSFIEYGAPENERCPVGHGGKGETQLIMADHPSLVDMSQLSVFGEASGPIPEWLRDSHEATRQEGLFWVERCVQGWVKELACKKT